MGTSLEGSQGLGAHALREEETLTKAVFRTRGVKWSGAHGNLKHCQGPEEARAGGSSGTDLGLLSRTQTWRGCQGT